MVSRWEKKKSSRKIEKKKNTSRLFATRKKMFKTSAKTIANTIATIKFSYFQFGNICLAVQVGCNHSG